MAKIVIITFLFALIACSSAFSIANLACQYVVNQTVDYNFLEFSNILTQSVNFTEAGTEYNITFHLCDRQVACSGGSASSDVYAILELNDVNSTCQPLTNTSSPVPSFYDAADPTEGVVLTWPAIPVNNSNNSVIFEVVLLCDENISLSAIDWQPSYTPNGDILTYTITGSGKAGCPGTLDQFIAFFENHQILFAIGFIIIGILALVAGLQFFNVTLFVSAALIVFLASAALIFELTTVQTSQTVNWIILVLCAVIGVGAGFAAVKVEKIGFFLLGSLFGAIAALFLYTFLLHFLNISDVVLYVIIVACGLLGGGLALWLWKDIIILATSFIGAYLSVRGFSLIFGGFPNEIAIAEGYAVFSYSAYAYLVAMIIIAGFGVVYQFKKKREDEENQNELYRASISNY